MKNKFFSLIAVICLLTYAECKAQQLVVDLTTGSTGGVPLPVGTPDDTWTLVQDPSMGILTPIVSNGSLWTGSGIWTPWASNACGQWISGYTITAAGPSFGCVPSTGMAGDYEYEMTFNSRCGNVSQVTLNLPFAGADDNLTDLIINGNLVPLAGPLSFNPLNSVLSLSINPLFIVPGVNVIRARANNCCIYNGLFICGTLTIDYGGWNNTTSNALGDNIGNDVVTDQNGDVYVAGTYFGGTDFTHPSCPAITIPGSTSASAYIAKYSSCGDLVWVNFDNGSGYTRGTGIAYDQTRNLVYLTGTEDRIDVQFQSTSATPCGPAPVAAAPTIAMHYYVAKFDAGTGNFLDIDHEFIGAATSVKPNVYIDVNNISTTTTDIYLGLTYITAKDEVIRVHKLQETGGVYGTSWINNSVTLTSPMAKTANDIIYHNNTGRVYLTGTFTKQLTFNATSITSAALSDAFVWEFNSGTGASGAAKALGTPANFRAEGTSVIEGGTRVYATGYFNRDIPSVFGSAFSYIGGPNNFRSYVVGFGGGLAVTWASEVRSVAGSDNMATGIAYSINAGGADEALITGTLTGNIAMPAAMVPNGTYTSFTPGQPKTFIASFNTAGGANWANTAMDNTPGSRHTSTKIAATPTTSYITGGYTNEFDYTFAAIPPTSGALFATPAGLMNSYFVRNGLNMGGGFFKTSPTSAVEASLPFGTKSSSGTAPIDVYPNPSNGVFSLNVGQAFIKGNEAIEVYDLMGKKVSEISATPGQTIYELNLTGEAKGIYFVKMLVNNKVEMKQIQLR